MTCNIDPGLHIYYLDQLIHVNMILGPPCNKSITSQYPSNLYIVKPNIITEHFLVGGFFVSLFEGASLAVNLIDWEDLCIQLWV